MRFTKRPVGGWLLASALLFAGCEVKVPEQPQPSSKPTGEPVQPGLPATDFTLPLLSGQGNLTLSEQKGKVVLLDFWATWCPPCRYELPALNKLYGELKDQGLLVVGMTVDRGSPASIKGAVDKFQLTYPVTLADEQVQSTFGGIRAVPTKFLINRKGEIAQTYLGVVPERQLREEIMAALAQ